MPLEQRWQCNALRTPQNCPRWHSNAIDRNVLMAKVHARAQVESPGSAERRDRGVRALQNAHANRKQRRAAIDVPPIGLKLRRLQTVFRFQLDSCVKIGRSAGVPGGVTCKLRRR